MKRPISLAVCLVAGGCSGTDTIDHGGADAGDTGDSGVAAACETDGTADVNGTVGGWTVEPVTAWFRSPFASGAALVMDELKTTCLSENDGEPTGQGQNLVLAFCDDSVSPGTYNVLSEQEFPWDASCPGQRIAGAVTEDSESGYEEDSVTGTVEITSMGDGCISGTFDVTFTDENQMTGSFNAVMCN